MPVYAVTVTLRDLDLKRQQDTLAAEVFDQLTKEATSLGLEGPPSDRMVEGDSFRMTLRITADDSDKAKELSWRALGSAVFAVHARHWIGRPGDTDPLDMVKGLEGKQVVLDAALVK